MKTMYSFIGLIVLGIAGLCISCANASEETGPAVGQDKKLIAWNEFFNQCAQQAFASSSPAETAITKRQAAAWLDLLEKIL